ncbi:MAG: polyA polymerase family protein [Nitrospirae bacterium]|nr:polyA polymerase family protein [Nitrospirota bacterium]
MEIITTHINADFDALASMVAAKKYYPGALLVFPGSPEKSVRDFIPVSRLELDIKKQKDIDIDKISRLIIVDNKKSGRIGNFSKIIGKKGLSVHIFDHHPPDPNDIKGEKEIIEPVGATTTIFVEMMRRDRSYILPAEATLLALGIYEETGSLIFPSTTVRDIEAAAYLLKKGANLNIVSGYMKRELGAEEIDLLNELIHSSKNYLIHDIRVKIAKASRDKYIGDVAYLAHKLRDIEETDALFLLVMMDERIQLIGRSHTPEVDASEIAQPFGGGGHPSASSAVIRDLSLEEAEEKLLDILREKIHPAKTARDIMTSPVKCITWDSAVSRAEKMMTRYEVNVLPVLKKEEYAGLQNQRFMAVIEDKRIIGAITRTDILRSIYESLLRKSRINSGEMLTEKPSMGKNLSTIMKSMFPPKIFSLLKLTGETAEGLGFSAYLVGGSVRDMLRGEANLDIDIVIEGDGIAFAQSLGSKLKAKVRSHNRFGTAVVVTEFLKFDIATARTEYYESPAALPHVEMSSIKKDLYRRDFTINTLAIKLNPGKFGQLLDFFGGQRDIKEKAIKILHNLSFIEDPTRAFRAIRFSERFGFKISGHTENLIKTAARINLFDKLSGIRLYDELVLLFLETEPLNAIKRLLKLDLLKIIHPQLKVTKSLEETFISIQETFAWFKLLFIEEELNKSHLFLMALFDELKAEERGKALERLLMPPNVRKEIMAAIEESRNALIKLRGASPKNIYFALRPLNLKTILFTMAKAKEKEQKKAVSLYLTSLRMTKPELTGKDLKTMGYTPGPSFTKILTAILEARLEGKIKTRAGETKFVKKEFPVK